MENIIICDIDGCLVNSSWIWKTITLLGIKDDATKWDFFSRNANALYGSIDKNLIKFLKAEIKIRNARILFLTARNVCIEEQTIKFIEKRTGLVYEQDFFISSRPGYDKSGSAESKRARLELIKKFYNPVFAIDDELIICELYSKHKIPTLFWVIGQEPKLANEYDRNLLNEYRAAIPLCDQVPENIKLKAYSMDELLEMFEDVINEINYRKAYDEHGDGVAFSLGYKDSLGATIFTGDVLLTSDNCYCTAIWDDRRPAVLSPGSQAIDFEDEAFFNSCRVITNLRHSPDFYENLVPEAALSD